MSTEDVGNEVPAPGSRRWPRGEVADNVLKFKQRPPDQSQRSFATEQQIPRATLQDWVRREEALDAEPELAAFIESPAGLKFLHRFQVAAHLMMNFVGPMGIRPVAILIEMVGLAPFLATSTGSLHKISHAIEEGITTFEEEQRPVLIEKMKHNLKEQGRERRQIIALEDETFHPAICLVAIAALSNFILL